ncbi:major facilitator superfamily domain-containing protein [Kockovaella imperatae]|uniref:Major facilitator superfamily domain-containing protein n=1 Tax=Kockovaella imperatae TaxID=4999 RepID=A0A1Y1UF43_9TREE|nr:major facilitator superfamily domain-containing protein [Kockovaella imperatae]ORX36134.1 major facilitator superfamily domain-containing protein [Kockovaella imperatae]
MIPLPASRKSSYNLLPRRPSRLESNYSRHREPTDGTVTGGGGQDDIDEDEDEDGSLDFEERLGLEEEIDGGVGGDRGLENTLEQLGFGAYHWRLLALCGTGWMSDNSSLQCIAVILPRVQINFDLSSKVVGLLSASTMAGMMLGAVGWGTVSDLLGRALPFNSTLFLTAVFGICASFAPNFPILCLWMFLLGTAVGGSMPTDGTLFLENLPHSKQYLLTLLSIFFSLGAVLSSVISLVFLPGASCSQFEGCDIAGKANDGWRRVLLVLGCFNMVCALCRWFLFRLHESPRYLVSNGRPDEAIVVLRAIASYNDNEMNIQSADVEATEDHGENKPLDVESNDKKHSEMTTTPISGHAYLDGERSPVLRASELNDGPITRPSSENSSRPPSRNYDAMGHGLPPKPLRHPIRTGSAFYADTSLTLEENENAFDHSFGDAMQGQDDSSPRAYLSRKASTKTLASVKSAKLQDALEWTGQMKRQIRRLFVPKWRRTVILMWIIWAAMSFSYTMFNVWLPAVLESRASGEGDEAIRSALSEFVLYSIAGCPGSMLGAWMIQTKLGRRRSLAIWTAATGLSTFAFIRVREQYAMVVSSMIISMAATAMYAVLYGMTPETFGTSIRGTACGTSAALSRLAGVVAPVFAGFLLTVSPSLPLFVSAAIFVLTAVCALLLPFERADGTGKGGAVMAH